MMHFLQNDGPSMDFIFRCFGVNSFPQGMQLFWLELRIRREAFFISWCWKNMEHFMEKQKFADIDFHGTHTSMPVFLVAI